MAIKSQTIVIHAPPGPKGDPGTYPAGIPVQSLAAAENDPPLVLLPGVRYRITADTDAAPDIVLDDTEASPEFAQEFSFVLITPAGGDPQVTLRYLSESDIALPPDFAWEADTVHELNVLDGLALAARWEAA